jgi:uncharacterized protein YegL
MTGEPIEALKNGVQLMIRSLRYDAYALETAHLSIITFDSDARQTVPLTDLASFQMPNLIASGTTSLVDGLKVLSNCIKAEVTKTTTEVKGDWKPLVFIITDGQPTDDWQSGLNEFKNVTVGNVVACAAGSRADTSVLKQITDIVVSLENDQVSIKSFFNWASSSICLSSTSIGSGTEVTGLTQMPPPPPEFVIVV